MPTDAVRPLLTPAGNFPQRSIPLTRQPARTWYRVHWADRSAVEFGLKPFHRFSHADCPHPMLYLGSTLQACLWEIFGDDVLQGRRTIALSRWEGRCISAIRVPALKVCAASTERTRSAMGVEKGSLFAANLAIPQAWGLAVQRHPAGFDAIKFTSRFVDQPCLALFGRPTLIDRLREKPLGSLSELNEAVDWLHTQQAALV